MLILKDLFGLTKLKHLTLDQTRRTAARVAYL